MKDWKGIKKWLFLGQKKSQKANNRNKIIVKHTNFLDEKLNTENI